MARFSACGGDDGEGSSNDRSRKRQRLPSIDDEEEETRNPRRIESDDDDDDDDDSTSDYNDREVVIEEESRFGKSEKSQSSSTKDSSSSLSLTLTDPDVLDCPICCEPLKLPIFQCDNGHLACSLCCTKVRNICPSCMLPIGYIRCRAMEKVVEASRVSCRNAEYGCKENMLYGNRFSHEKLCVFTPCSCPIHGCNYTAYYKDLNDHVSAIHKADLIPFVWGTSLSISLDFAEQAWFLQEENDGQVIVVQVFRGLHLVYVTVCCISPPVPGKLLCYLTNETVDSSLRQGLLVTNIQKVKNEHPKDGFMVVPSYMLPDSFLISFSHGTTFVHP